MITLALKALDVGLCFLRKTWRPVTCFAAGLVLFFTSAAVLINAVIIPLSTHAPLDLNGLGGLLTGAAAFIASLMPFVVARTYEKTKGCE